MKSNKTSKARAREYWDRFLCIIGEQMVEQNVSKNELAKRMGMSVQELSRYFNDPNVNPTLVIIAKFETALNFRVFY